MLNTEGYSQEELDKMNIELKRRLASDELEGVEESEREKTISERVADAMLF